MNKRWKILIVGSQKRWAMENYYMKALKKEGAHVEILPVHDFFYDFYYSSFLNRIWFNIGFSNIYKFCNKELMSKVETYRPDVIWVFKGMEIYPESLNQMKRKGVFLVNFNPDHPFKHFYTGSGNSNVLESILLYNIHFCYSEKVTQEIRQKYGVNSFWLPFGYDLQDDEYDLIKNVEEVNRACFVGNPDVTRCSLVLNLTRVGLKVDVYGNGWSQMRGIKDNSSIECFAPVFGMDFWNTIRRYRVQLNAFRPHNIDSHNMRTFEVPAAGSIMLAPKSAEHRSFFKQNEEAFFYSNEQEAVEMAENILSLSHEEAQRVRDAARARSIESDYSYDARARFALSQF